MSCVARDNCFMSFLWHGVAKRNFHERACTQENCTFGEVCNLELPAESPAGLGKEPEAPKKRRQLSSSPIAPASDGAVLPALTHARTVFLEAPTLLAHGKHARRLSCELPSFFLQLPFYSPHRENNGFTDIKMIETPELIPARKG